ncbi:unnamed protein product [Boreogadus saida]
MYWVQRDSLAASYTCPDCQSRLEQDPQDQRGPPGPDPPQGAGRRPSSAHTHPSQPPPPQQSVSGQTPQLRSAHSFPSRPTSVSISSSTLPRVETLITASFLVRPRPLSPQRDPRSDGGPLETLSVPRPWSGPAPSAPRGALALIGPAGEDVCDVTGQATNEGANSLSGDTSCKKPKKPQRRQMNNRLKPLTLAYDGDADM